MQWKNSDATIDWFTKLENKSRMRFFQFDVVDFYASITPKLLENSLTFAARYITNRQIKEGYNTPSHQLIPRQQQAGMGQE